MSSHSSTCVDRSPLLIRIRATPRRRVCFLLSPPHPSFLRSLSLPLPPSSSLFSHLSPPHSHPALAPSPPRRVLNPSFFTVGIGPISTSSGTVDVANATSIPAEHILKPKLPDPFASLLYPSIPLLSRGGQREVRVEFQAECIEGTVASSQRAPLQLSSMARIGAV